MISSSSPLMKSISPIPCSLANVRPQRPPSRRPQPPRHGTETRGHQPRARDLAPPLLAVPARRAPRQIDRRAAIRTVHDLDVTSRLRDLFCAQRTDEILPARRKSKNVVTVRGRTGNSDTRTGRGDRYRSEAAGHGGLRGFVPP